jgi:hypothetical protein
MSIRKTSLLNESQTSCKSINSGRAASLYSYFFSKHVSCFTLILFLDLLTGVFSAEYSPPSIRSVGQSNRNCVKKPATSRFKDTTVPFVLKQRKNTHKKFNITEIQLREFQNTLHACYSLYAYTA